MNNELPSKIKKEFLRLKTRGGRRKSPYYICEGRRCGQEAYRYAAEDIVTMVSSEKCQWDFEGVAVPQYQVSERELLELCQTENPQGGVFLMKKPEVTSRLDFTDPFTLVLDGIAEPGNMGTILRTALAVGLKDVVLTRSCVDPFNAKAIRAGMGGQFSLKFYEYTDLAALHKQFPDRSVWLTSPRAEYSLYDDTFDLRGSFLVFGEEGDGIQDFTVGQRVNIPMPGNVESLNVAQAATLFLFEGVRQKLF